MDLENTVINNTVNVFSQSFRTTTNKKKAVKGRETYFLSPPQAGLWGNTTGDCKTGSLGNSNQECRPWLVLATRYGIRRGTTICCLTFALFQNTGILPGFIIIFGFWGYGRVWFRKVITMIYSPSLIALMMVQCWHVSVEICRVSVLTLFEAGKSGKSVTLGTVTLWLLRLHDKKEYNFFLVLLWRSPLEPNYCNLKKLSTHMKIPHVDISATISAEGQYQPNVSNWAFRWC